MKRVLIRCDASKSIGLGHVVRTTALAKIFNQKGFETIFAMKLSLGIEFVQKQGFKVEKFKDEYSYSQWIKNIIQNKDFDIFIGDIRDGFPSELISFMKDKGILSVAIDEPSDYATLCDLCFFPPHSKIDEKDYNGRVFKGFKYVVLREEFYNTFEKKRNILTNILVMMGGTDANNLSSKVVRHLCQNKEEFNLKVISNIHIEKEEFKGLRNIEYYDFVDNFEEFLNDIDFAVVTFGVSSYELLMKKIPAIHICITDDHQSASQMFEKEGYAKSYSLDEIGKLENFTFSDLKIERKLPENRVIKEILNANI